MSAETVNPHSVEVPSYREMFRHFGRKAIEWALGTNINYTKTVERHSTYATTTNQGELRGGMTNAPEWNASESAPKAEQRNKTVVEMRTAPAAGYVIGEVPTAAANLRNQAPTNGIIGGEQTPNLRK